MDALDVFSHSIRYLKDRAIEIIRERTGDEQYSAKDIQWVITVPAIWKPAAKQFMREAAYQVKYHDHRIAVHTENRYPIKRRSYIGTLDTLPFIAAEIAMLMLPVGPNVPPKCYRKRIFCPFTVLRFKLDTNPIQQPYTRHSPQP